MAPEIHWQAITLRLALTILAGGLLGAERSRTGHSAGLRTTLLVTLAASVAMIQMNLLLETNGKPPNSYVVMDMMRLPLGILTGVGFIGAGAIVRKNELVIGLTTAATLWFATVVGLCLGGGQLILGCVSAVVGYAVLRGLRSIETRIELYQTGELRIVIAGDHLSARDLRDRLERAKFRVKSISVAHNVSERRKTLGCQVRWPSVGESAEVPQAIAELEQLPDILELEWRGSSAGPS